MSSFTTVTAADTQVALNSATHGRQTLTVTVPPGGTTVYVGPTGVSTSTGARVRANETQVVDVTANAVAYVITATGLTQDVSVRLTSTARVRVPDVAVPASPTTYTQTYSTTTATVPAATAATVATADGSDAASTQTLANALKVVVNALVADSLVNRKLINALIDGQQAAGIAL